MSRFNKLAHSICYCHYHIVWAPKYRFRILEGGLKISIEESIKLSCEQLNSKIVELNIQIGHVHIILMISPKNLVSKIFETIKGKNAIIIFNKIPSIRKRYWGNHFCWTRGYGVDTVGLDLEMIRKYVKYQEKKEKQLQIQG